MEVMHTTTVRVSPFQQCYSHRGLKDHALCQIIIMPSPESKCTVVVVGPSSLSSKCCDTNPRGQTWNWHGACSACRRRGAEGAGPPRPALKAHGEGGGRERRWHLLSGRAREGEVRPEILCAEAALLPAGLRPPALRA
eukprot:544790-Rhodomonas_salina.1